MKNKGITLVALVITIILLLILAGITINSLTGSGLFEKAKEAKEVSVHAQAEEELKLIVNEWIMEKYSGTTKTIDEFLNEKVQKEELEGYNQEENYEIYKKGYAITIDGDGNIIEEIHEVGKVINITGRIISEENGTTEVEEGTVEENAKLKITFNVKLENGEITGVTSTGTNTATLDESKNTVTYITDGTEKEITFTIIGKIGVKDITKKYTVSVANKYAQLYKSDGSWDGKVNSPLLMKGMTGIYWDENDKMVEVTTKNKDNWYNYEEKRWANAVTKEGKTITGYWTWIPRFEYNIDQSNKKINVKFIKTETKTASEDYAHVHPAFTDGTSNEFSNGEWKAEIPGFWVAKFPAGYAGGNNSVTPKSTGIKYGETDPGVSNYYGDVTASVEMKYPVFLGQTYLYNYINVGDIYNLSRNLTKEGNPYGLDKNKTDSHMMKNSEWGAVAYLTHSQYGLEGKDVIHINNVNMRNKVHKVYSITGYAGQNTTTNELISTTLGETVEGTTISYVWYTKNGQKGSSTQNITGVYDLSGCGAEYIAGYILNEAGETSRTKYGGTLIEKTSTPYTTIYPHSNSDTSEENWNIYKNTDNRYGDATIETSIEAENKIEMWNKNMYSFPQQEFTFIARGGSGSMGGACGLFTLCTKEGCGIGAWGFRVILIGI